MSNIESVIRLEGGKYEVRHSNGTGLRALRYGQPWRDMTGDGLVLALVHRIEELEARPIPMVLYCPSCGQQHIDAPDTDKLYVGANNAKEAARLWTNPPHRSHLCHYCGTVWRPADVPTEGVAATQTKGKEDKLVPGARIIPEMLREMHAHLPFAVKAQGNIARWEWEAAYLNAALCEPNKPCACCGVTPHGAVLDEPAGETD